MYGMSLLRGNELLHASEVNYGDCEAWQVVCPACCAPVHKRGSALTARQYLAHYHSRGRLDCELRVVAIVKERLDPIIIMPKGQELEKFLRRFQDILVESMPMFSRPQAQAYIKARMQRPEYRRMLRLLRQDMPLYYSVLLPAIRNEMSLGFGPEVFDTLEAVVRYLTAPNTWSAYSFAITCGLLVIATAATVARENGVTGDGRELRSEERKLGFKLGGGGTIDDLHRTGEYALPMLSFTDRELGEWFKSKELDFYSRLADAVGQAMTDTCFRFACAVYDARKLS
jgi:hypothetical protein